MAEVADFELEKTRKECIKAIRDYETVGFGLVENVKETADSLTFSLP